MEEVLYDLYEFPQICEKFKYLQLILDISTLREEQNMCSEPVSIRHGGNSLFDENRDGL